MKNEKLKLSNKRMGEFLIGDLFKNISGSKSNIEKIIKISDCKKKPDGYFNAISATSQNNQIAFYIKPKNVETVLKNKLSISANGSGTGAIFYQKHNFLIAQDAYVIDLKNTNYNSNENVLLFIAGEQKKNTDKYNYSLKAGWNRVKKDVLTLPIKEDGTPDYEWMDQYISQIKKEKEKEINIYLEKNHLNNSILTEQEKLFLDKWRSGSVKMGEFLIGEIFNVKSGKALNYDELTKNGNYPYVVRSTKNNGVREFMDHYDKSYLNEGNSISLGVDTSSYFYQKNNFFSGVKIKILYLLNYKLNQNIAMFLISVLNRQVSSYGYAGGKPFKQKDFMTEKITLPIKEDGTPDYEAMEQYILIMKKMAVKKLNQKYNDTISKTEEVANNH